MDNIHHIIIDHTHPWLSQLVGHDADGRLHVPGVV